MAKPTTTSSRRSVTILLGVVLALVSLPQPHVPAAGQSAWVEQAELTASDGTVDDSFGSSVAIIAAEGSALVWSRVPKDNVVFRGTPTKRMWSVTVGGPGLVAVGHDGYVGYEDAAVWTSPDGISWSQVPHDKTVFGGEGNQRMWSVTVGGPGLVAVGRDASDAAVWTSPDGISWSRVPHDETVFGGGDSQSMGSVTVGGPGLVAVGHDGYVVSEDAAVWTSPDGISWSRVPHDETVFGGEGSQSMGSVTVGGPGLVAVGRDASDAAVWTSPDGISWSQVPHDETVFGEGVSQSMGSVTVGGPGLVAVGYDASDAAVWTSPDGISWSRVPHNETVFGGFVNQWMWSVTVGGPGLVAVGSDKSNAAVWVADSDVFVDDDGSIFEADIQWLASVGITKGCNPPVNDLFCPDELVTRGQMAAFLVRALGYSDAGGGDLFTDDETSVFEADIDRLGTAGVTKGCNPPVNDRYCPDDFVTRGQMAAFLVRALGYTDNGGGDLFTDDDTSVFEADIDRLGTAGVTKGCNPPINDRYCPNDFVTRGQMAAFLHRALG